MFLMKDEYLVGIKEIDEEHKELFRIANEAYEVFGDDYIADKFDHIVGIITKLKEYAITHFANEEAYMEKVNYKRRLSHKIEHIEFVDKLNEIDFDTIDQNQSDALLEILDFLGNWLVHHILENDKKIGEVV